MATAVAVGSLIASGASAAAGVTGVAGIGFGASSVLAGGVSVTPGFLSFGQIAAGLGIAGRVLGGFEGASAIENQGAVEQQAAAFRRIELKTQAKREETQAALEGLEREKELRVLLASQRARFGGAGIDPFTGSPLRIQEVTEDEIKRKDRQAGLFSSLTVSSLNRQATQETIAGEVASTSAKTKARTTRFSAITGSVDQVSALKKTIK